MCWGTKTLTDHYGRGWSWTSKGFIYPLYGFPILTIPNIATLNPDTYERLKRLTHRPPSFKNQWKVAFAQKHPLWWIDLCTFLLNGILSSSRSFHEMIPCLERIWHFCLCLVPLQSLNEHFIFKVSQKFSKTTNITIFEKIRHILGSKYPQSHRILLWSRM